MDSKEDSQEAVRQKKKSRSFFRAIAEPMLAVGVLMMLFMIIIVTASGLFKELRTNSADILTQRVLNRKDFLRNNMVNEWSDLNVLADKINAATTRLLQEGEISLVTLDEGTSAPTPLLNEIVDDLVTELRAKRTSGIFLIFNNESLAEYMETGDFGAKPGIYIRDTDPLSYASVRNEDLSLKTASSVVVRRMNITMAPDWRPSFTFDEDTTALYGDFLARPFQAAYEATGVKNAVDYGYWGLTPFGDTPQTPYTLSYTIPLILEDGTVYGVLGVDVTLEYLQELLPHNELNGEGNGAYLLAVCDLPTDEQAREDFLQNPDIRPVLLDAPSDSPYFIWNGEAFPQQIRLTRLEEDGTYRLYRDRISYFCAYEALSLYSRNAPFETQSWVLVGIVPEKELFGFVRFVLLSLITALVGTIVIGAAGILLASRRMNRAVHRLSREVEEAQHFKGLIPKLTPTGITEIDAFSEAITNLSRDAINASKEEQRRVERERDYDFLTGLMNRRAFYRLGQMLFLDPGQMKTAAMMMIDLDNLKVINDRYGHDWGDQYIHQAAECFAQNVPPSTIVARVSGDEFFLLFYGYEDKAEIRSYIRGLFSAITETVFPLPHEKKDYLRVSGGVAWYPDDSKDFNELMTLADFAMYHVKMQGKGRFQEFDAKVFKKHNQTLQGLEELDELLHSRELMNYYFQPIIDAKTGATYAYEALMRVTMPNLKGPEAVLKYARQERRLHEVERMTWYRALACYRRLLDNNKVSEEAYLFINSIASQYLREEEVEDLTERFHAILPKVVVEITEADDMSDEALAAKRAIPYFSGKFALDDYGTGYNTDMMLFQLNPAYVKVDISFVRGIDTNPDTQRLVENLVEYAHERDMVVIAEGIETEEELTQLLALKVDLLQGFYLAMPEPVVTQINPDALEIIQNYKERGT